MTREDEDRNAEEADVEEEGEEGVEGGADDDDDNFLEQMFYDFASDPEDEDCVFAYWSDGIGIERVRVDSVWQYREVSA